MYAAHQHPHPGLLKEILSQLAVSREIEQIPQQAVLVLDNRLVEQQWILPLKALRDLCAGGRGA